MDSTNFDQEKLNLEKEKFNKDFQFKEAELKLKEEEFELKKKELHNNRYKLTPAQATIFAALLTLFGTLAGIYLKHIVDQRPKDQKQSLISITDTAQNEAEIISRSSETKPHIPAAATAHVYICNSKTARKYHLSASCYHLKACKYDTLKISLEDAREMGRTLCGDER